MDSRVTFSIPPTRLIHVDIDPQEIGRNYPPTLAVIADTAELAAGLLGLVTPDDVPAERRAAWLAETLA